MRKYPVKSKDVSIKIEKQYLRVEVKQNNEFIKLIDDKLAWKVRTDESGWCLVPGEHIHVRFDLINKTNKIMNRKKI
jgi:hypothetical protein